MNLMPTLCIASLLVVLMPRSTSQLERPVRPNELYNISQGNLHLAMVRMDYSDWAGNHDHTDTTCHIVNTSLTSLTLDKIYIVGAGGITQILATSPKFVGRVLPAFAHVQFKVDKSIPGVRPQTLHNQPSIAQQVIATWSGPKDALRLTSVIRRVKPGDDDNRTVYQIEGRTITP